MGAVAVVAAVLTVEIYVVFVSRSDEFRIEGADAYDVTEFGSGTVVAHAFLMRGEGLNAISLRFSSAARTVAHVQWTLWRGLPDWPQEMTRAFESADRIELRAGRQWKRFAVTRDASSRDRWYTIEVRLLGADPVAGRVPRIALVASTDNPERGGVLWVGGERKPGSLFLRAGRHGRTMYRRFVIEVEPHLPAVLQIRAVQWAIALACHWATFVMAFAILADARPRCPRRARS